MKSPLEPRDGISATTLRAPGGLQTHARQHEPVPASIHDWLTSEFPHATPGELAALVDPDLGSLVDHTGRPVSLEDPVTPGGFYFFHRPVPPEPRVPFETSVIYEDARLLVVDKPHFLASTPNGRFVRECVVTRLRVERGEPNLVAIHRLDRVTAGLLVLSRDPATRGRYQRLFQDRQVRKTYRALAVLPPEFDPGAFPMERESRIEKDRGTRGVKEVPGPVNARSRLEYSGQVGWRAGRPVGLFTLTPHTGKTHQLRVHMAGAGVPILGDPVYPVDLAPDPYDFSSPLRLCASQLAFTDPVTGQRREFESRIELRIEDPGATASRQSSR